MRRQLFAALGALTVALSAMLAGGISASAAEDQECIPAAPVTYTTKVTDRPDSGLHGTWAHDTFTRTTVVADNCDGTYTLKISDKGSFTTIDGAKSPGTGVPLAPSFTGKFSGGATIKVTSDVAPHKPTGGKDGSTSTGAWATLFFDGNRGILLDWGWNYAYCGEKWINAQSGNSGDVTGLLCVNPPKLRLVLTGTDCTGEASAAAKLKVVILGPVPHLKVTVPYATSDGQSGTIIVPKRKASAMAVLTFAEDAGDGSVEVVLGEGKKAKRISVQTDCTTPPTTTTTVPTTTTTATTTTRTDPPGGEQGVVSYADCDAVIKAGKAPIHKGTPGFRAELDRDGDGIGCELEERAGGVQNVSNTGGLASTGASGVGTFLVLGGLLLTGGTASLILIRRRRTTS